MAAVRSGGGVHYDTERQDPAMFDDHGVSVPEHQNIMSWFGHLCYRYIARHVFGVLILVWGFPFMRYRSQWRSIVYETDDWWEINFAPWFLRESKILLGPDKLIESTVPENPTFSLRQVIQPEVAEDGTVSYSTNGLLSSVAQQGDIDNEQIRAERLAAWRKSLKEARDFYRFYLVVYIFIFLGWFYVDGGKMLWQ